MNWLFFALLAPLLFTGGNYIDKFMIENVVHDAWAMPTYEAFMASLAGGVLWVLTGFPTPPLTVVVPILIVGALTALGAVLYFSAMSLEEASSVIVLMQMQPVFVLVLSLVFLSEVINGQQLLGFVLILGAAVAISINRGMGGLKLSRAFFLILLTDLIWASALVLLKHVVAEVDLLHIMAFESWGLALGSFTLYLLVPRLRKAFNQSIRIIPRRGVGMLALGQTVFVVAKLVAFTAVSLGPLALVSVLGSTQVFFGLVVGTLLTTIAPAIFKEDISGTNLARKGVLALVMFGGILLVN